MLSLGSGTRRDRASPPATVELLAGAHRQISDLLREMPAGAESAVARLGLVGALRQVVEDELVDAFDEVSWQIEPGTERKAKELPMLTADVLFHAAREAMRNAARHGRKEGEAPLCLCVRARWQQGLELVIEDDGVGLEGDGLLSSGGQGLALHSTMMAIVGGMLAIESLPGRQTRVSLALPEVSAPQ
jgi:signal transduction histidine kinase